MHDCFQMLPIRCVERVENAQKHRSTSMVASYGVVRTTSSELCPESTLLILRINAAVDCV